MPYQMPIKSPSILLADNGSLEPAATLGLRTIAARLSEALGQTVVPVSLLHSTAVPPDQLDGQPAELLADALAGRLEAGERDFLIVPLFFGPSGALTDLLPTQVTALKSKFPGLRVRVAPQLVDTGAANDERMAAILEENVRAKIADAPSRPAVIMVGHGSPARAVTAVREHLARQLRTRLGPTVRGVLAASMERRPESEYDFNEPLLERAFDRPGFDAGPVIVAMLFLSPGRHAGPDGDIARICADAQQRHPGLRIVMTDLVGRHPGLIPILVDRVRAGLVSIPL
jgi:sirohydrochlorin ferrochelatase